MANADAMPNIDEYGPGACYTLGGMACGCAVCTAGDILVRYNKYIPRLSNGTPNMRALGIEMGSLCRAANGTQHGLALTYVDHTNRKWGTCCITLILRKRGLVVRHGTYTWQTIRSFAEQRKPVALPGHYGRIPRVSTSSYSSQIPATGRSDSFTGAHMVVQWGVASRWSDGRPRQYNWSDSDFGSAARSVVPPHSRIGATYAQSYWEAYKWPVVVVDTPLPALAGAWVAKVSGKVSIHPAPGVRYRSFWLYSVTSDASRITGRAARRTEGMSADCSQRKAFTWSGQRYVLVKLMSGALKGKWVASSWEM